MEEHKIIRWNWIEKENVTTSSRGRRIQSYLLTCPKCEKQNGRHRAKYCQNCGEKMYEEEIIKC